MKKFTSSLVQLAAIIMLMITLAISTAAFAQWTGSEGDSAGVEDAAGTQAVSLSVNR